MTLLEHSPSKGHPLIHSLLAEVEVAHSTPLQLASRVAAALTLLPLVNKAVAPSTLWLQARVAAVPSILWQLEEPVVPPSIPLLPGKALRAVPLTHLPLAEEVAPSILWLPVRAEATALTL